MMCAYFSSLFSLIKAQNCFQLFIFTSCDCWNNAMSAISLVLCLLMCSPNHALSKSRDRSHHFLANFYISIAFRFVCQSVYYVNLHYDILYSCKLLLTSLLHAHRQLYRSADRFYRITIATIYEKITLTLG